MKLAKLDIAHFRNLSSVSFEPNEHLNFFIGLNGQGKTSILEAIAVLGSHRSFRGATAAEWIAFNEARSQIRAELCLGHARQDWSTEIALSLERLEAAKHRTVLKIATLNGKIYKNSTAFLRQRFGNAELGFHSIAFCPEDHDLIRGEPAGRRIYLDRMLAALDVSYLESLHRYRKLLEQRNAVLRAFEQPTSKRKALLESFEPSWVLHGAQILHSRLSWANAIYPFFESRLQDIAPRQRRAPIFYVSSCNPRTYLAGQGAVPSLDELKEHLVKEVELNREKEWRLGSSFVGPHRDDFGIGSESDSLRSFGSQGEVRSAVLALKLAEIDFFRDRTGHRPLLLLDDFSSELDHERRQYLLRYLSDTDLQVFVTTTEDLFNVGSRFYLRSGMIENRID